MRKHLSILSASILVSLGATLAWAQDSAEVPVTPQSQTQQAPAETVEVKEGDSLADISYRVFGTHRFWHAFFILNKDQLSSPESITAGMKLKIPMKKWDTLKREIASEGPMTHVLVPFKEMELKL